MTVEMQKIGVVAKMNSREARTTAGELAEWLGRRGLEVALDEATREEHGFGSLAPFEVHGEYDLVVVLGGDGSLLAVARTLEHKAPILGVNLGGLGFLTEINRSELYPSLIDVLAGRFELEERYLLAVELRRGGEVLSRYRVLNDAVISKGAMARIVRLAVHVDGRLVARYRSDGLIVSTPTGSTAYNLSAGGPIVYPGLPVAIVTPLCAHTLTLRPMVVPDSCFIDITLETPDEEVFITLDGQEGERLAYRDTVRATRSQTSIDLVRTTGRTFYDSLRGKLRWGG